MSENSTGMDRGSPCPLVPCPRGPSMPSLVALCLGRPLPQWGPGLTIQLPQGPPTLPCTLLVCQEGAAS